MPTPTCISSPGKVLVAGGYLVLDPAYSGIVVSTSSRFYTVIQTGGKSTADVIRPIQISVRSPQFVGASWNYDVEIVDDVVKVEPHNSDDSKNKFVYLAVARALSLALEIKGVKPLQSALAAGLDILILGDNDFYSQRAQLAARDLPANIESLSKLPSFLHTGVPISQVHKTGLGSSAALVTSLVSALLLHLEVIPADSFSSATASDGRKLAHNLAQYAHCLAQGKVGSGFDVSAAAFGSQLYTRFHPEVIQSLMEEGVKQQPLETVLSPSNASWNYRAESFRLPPQVRIMLADVDAGSDTPSLVGKVLKWRKENSEQAKKLWDTIDQHNKSLSENLLKLSEMALKDPDDYKMAVKYLSTLQSVQWLAHPASPYNERSIAEVFLDVRRAAEAIREHMRMMGELSGVPIEPREQTQLLNSCVFIAGVICGGVPGAGGYDAIWLLVLDPVGCSPADLPSTRVEHVWSRWKDLSISPLLASESVASGTKEERLEDVPGLKEVVSRSMN